MKQLRSLALACALLTCGAVAAAQSSGNPLAAASSTSLLERLTSPTLTATTIPPNGDLNPYGVAFVPTNFARGGLLKPRDILVSNFNNSGNLQGTGTTIVRITQQGQTSVFFQGSPGLGLTTALAVLSKGFVIVGNVPTTDGTTATVQQGSLLILDKNGQLLTTLQDPTLLDGPWDMTAVTRNQQVWLFVSNVLSGTVTRLDMRIQQQGRGSSTLNLVNMTQIASGYVHRTDPAALVIGPTGLVYDSRRDVLYVASTGDNAIFSIPDPLDTQSDQGMGTLVYQDDAHLRGPLGLVLAPNGNLITSNGDAVNTDPAFPSELVEFTREGQFVAQMPVDTGGIGGAFGIALMTFGAQTFFAAVDDITNTVELWVVKTNPRRR